MPDLQQANNKQKEQANMANETKAPAPEVTVGLPSGLDKSKVLARKKALIAAGTDTLLAEKLAIDAESAQLKRDSMEEEIQQRRKLRKPRLRKRRRRSK